MVLLSKKQIDELAAKYPRGSQEGNVLDAIVSYKIQFPDKRGSREGYWYIIEASRIDNDVEFFGIVYAPGLWSQATSFKLSYLESLINRGEILLLDNEFKPAKVRELMDEPPMRAYIRTEEKKAKRAKIMASRDEIHETIYNFFKPLESDGKISMLIADELTDRTISQMLAFKERELLPAIIHALAQWLKLERVGA